MSPFPQEAQGPVEPIGVDVDGRDPGPVPGEVEGHGPAHTTGRSGDHGDGTVDPVHVRCPLPDPLTCKKLGKASLN